MGAKLRPRGFKVVEEAPRVEVRYAVRSWASTPEVILRMADWRVAVWIGESIRKARRGKEALLSCRKALYEMKSILLKKPLPTHAGIMTAASGD